MFICAACFGCSGRGQRGALASYAKSVAWTIDFIVVIKFRLTNCPGETCADVTYALPGDQHTQDVSCTSFSEAIHTASMSQCLAVNVQGCLL